MELSQQLSAIGLVLALIIFAAALAKRRGWLRLRMTARTRSGPQLELIDRLALTPQHGLHLVRIEDRILLLATYATGVEVVESAPASDRISAAASAGSSGGAG